MPTDSTEILHWAIFDSVADDFEHIDLIVSSVQSLLPEVEEDEIALEIDRLLVAGLLQTVDKQEIGYGMTSEGCAVWEGYCSKFSDAAPDWSDHWTVDTDFASGTGYVLGTTREACEAALANQEQSGVHLDRGTLRHSTIDGFQAKYYKFIQGGHRIDFNFRTSAA